uniref:Uncharacterized protein n=1 Tax=Octopus bimaculoides TaxID=37653 RepID=A0A0L8IED1_OCTBM
MDFSNMDFGSMPSSKKIEGPPTPTGVVEFMKSFWTDPLKWQIVKSLAVFGGAVYLARVISSYEASIKAEALA